MAQGTATEMGHHSGPKYIFLVDESDDPVSANDVLDNSSDLGMNESESFVSESSLEMMCESDVMEDRCDVTSDSENNDTLFVSSAPRANMCIITREYSSSYSDAIEGLDTDIPVLDPCEYFTESVAQSNFHETSQETPEESVL